VALFLKEVETLTGIRATQDHEDAAGKVSPPAEKGSFAACSNEKI
jgi:hypothetical protein